MNVNERVKTIKTDLPAIFLALKKKETPVLAKIFAVIAVGYALSPIDLVPDFIPILGYLDDIIILPILIMLTIKFIPIEVLEQCRLESQNLWTKGKPKKWYYALPIVFIWLLFIKFILKSLIF